MKRNELRKVLILDASAADAAQMTSVMERDGFAFEAKRVEDRASFLQALEGFAPDLVLVEHGTPGLDGRAAIELARKTCPEAPVVVVSCALGDELATELLKTGAKDYVLKSNLDRLVPVITRALTEEYAIRERKRIERELRESHALLKGLCNAIPVGVVVRDQDGLITFVNNEAERVIGMSWQELVGQRSKVAERHATDEQGHPLAETDMPHMTVLRTGEPVRMFRMETDGPGHRLKLLVNAAPLQVKDGQVLSVVTTLEDVTQLGETLELLARREQELHLALRAARMITWVLTVPGMELSHSEEAAEFFERPAGFTVPSLERFLEIVHPDDHEEVTTSLAHAIAEGPQYKSECRVQMGDGRWRWFSIQGDVVRDAAGTALKLVGVIWDSHERKEDDIALRRANRALQVISAVNDELIHASDVQALLDSVCRVTVETGGYALAWVGKLEYAPVKRARLVSQYGCAGNMADLDIRWDDSIYGQGPTGQAIKTRQAQVVNQIPDAASLEPWRAAVAGRFGSGIWLPLIHQDEVLGTLTIYAQEQNAFSPTEVALLNDLADDLAYGMASIAARTERDRIRIENDKYQAQLQRSLVASIQTLSTMLEMRDAYTAGHQHRVAMLCEAIARELGLDEHRIEGLRLAASVHDVGKIRVPSEILNKPGRLEDVEFSLIKLHPKTGYEILKDVEFPWPIARIVLEHHERMDGTGYPRGLRGDETLLESRIVMVADVVEAMVSHRPYRPGLGLQAALAEIRAHRGSWYDPAVVDGCLAVFDSGKFSFEAEFASRPALGTAA